MSCGFNGPIYTCLPKLLILNCTDATYSWHLAILIVAGVIIGRVLYPQDELASGGFNGPIFACGAELLILKLMDATWVLAVIIVAGVIIGT